MERYKGPAPSDMDDAQKTVYEEISRTRTTSVERGSYMPWLSSPALADAAQNLGRVCRYETSLSQMGVEIAILATAYANKAAAEWTVHVGEARKTGLEDVYIAALAKGHVPPFPAQSKEAAIYAVAADLLEHKRVSQAHYEAGVNAIGEQGMVELVSIVGYYTYSALTCNAFELSDPEAPESKAPWEEDAKLA